MITFAQYFGDKIAHPDATPERQENARELLRRVNGLLDEARAAGVPVDAIDPDTGTPISGSRGGAGDGGFRLQGSATGRLRTAHKDGRAVDQFDPGDALDVWLDGFEDGRGGNRMLEKHGLYREHPSATPGWCHLQSRPVASGKRTFYP